MNGNIAYFRDILLIFIDFMMRNIKRINNADLFLQPSLIIFTKGANNSGLTVYCCIMGKKRISHYELWDRLFWCRSEYMHQRTELREKTEQVLKQRCENALRHLLVHSSSPALFCQ